MDVRFFRQLHRGHLIAGAVNQVLVGHAGSGAQFEVDPGAQAAAGQADQKDGGGEGDQTDATGAGGGEFLVGAEAAEDEQGGGEEAHGQGIDPEEGDDQPNGFEHQAEARPAGDEQGEDFLEQVAHQQDEGEPHHGQGQRGQHLPGEIFVKCFQTVRDHHKIEVVAGPGIEPGTQGFSVLCSTN